MEHSIPHSPTLIAEPPRPQSCDAILELAEQESKHYRFHHRFLWDIHLFSGGISTVFILTIPVLLLAMLWIQDQWRSAINLTALLCSGLSAILQLVPNQLRVRERAFQLRRIHHVLELAVAQYKSGVLTQPELIQVLKQVEKSHEGESCP
ncbi:MAG TPA: hypothetical protein VFQ43_09485 [Nitrososphaera sp.]|nr:hypothetical protein [Nitrososphaera sp.]